MKSHIILVFLISLNCSLQSQNVEEEIRLCEEMLVDTTKIRDTVSSIEIGIPTNWSGGFVGDLPGLYLLNTQFKDTVRLMSYHAYDVSDHYPYNEYKGNLILGNTNVLFDEKRKNSIFSIEFSFKNHDSGWVYKVELHSHSTSALSESLCDVKFILAQMINKYVEQ